MNLRVSLFLVLGLLSICHGNRPEEVGTTGLLRPQTDVPEILSPPPSPSPAAIPINCSRIRACRIVPVDDYKPSQSDFQPIKADSGKRFQRSPKNFSVPDVKKFLRAMRSSLKKLDGSDPAHDDKPSDYVKQSLGTEYSEKPSEILAEDFSIPSRWKRSPLVVDQVRGPVIVPFFCHKMPCSGPLSSFLVGKGESSGRYQLPERRRTLN